jgi:WD40 repeat protein
MLYDAKSLRKLLTLRGHLGFVTAVRFSPDFSLVATGSFDHSAKLWDLKTGRQLATLGGHADIVSDLVFSSDGKALVTIGGEGEIKVWNVLELVHGNVFIQNRKPSFRLGLSADERALAGLDSAGRLHVWDRLSETETHSFQTGESDYLNVAFAPNGKLLAWVASNSLGVLDLKSGKQDTNSIQGNQTCGLLGLAFSPDSREIAFSSHTNVMLYDLKTRIFHPFASFGEEICALRYSPDGGLLAFGHEHGRVSLWDRETGKKLTEHSGVHVFLTSGLAFSRDGRWLATSGSQTINLWPVTRKGLGRPRTFTAHVGFIPAVAFSPDATRLISASSDHTLKFWNTMDGAEVGTLYGHDSCVSDVLFSQDGNMIFSSGQDGTVRIWGAAPLDNPGRKTGTTPGPR